jgi:hypothetical protein
MLVLKLTLLVNLQQTVDTLVLFTVSCHSIIILENILN